MIGAIVDAVRKVRPSPVAGVDAELRRVRQQLAGLAGAEADGAEKLSKLNEDLRAAIESDAATDAIEGEILGADADLRRLATKRLMMEKMIAEKQAALTSKRRRIRVEALTAERSVLVEAMPANDEEYVAACLVLSAVLGKREKLERDAYAITERLATLGVAVAQQNYGLPLLHIRLEAADPAARRERFVPGESAFRWVNVSVPVKRIDYHVSAVEEDEPHEATASA